MTFRVPTRTLETTLTTGTGTYTLAGAVASYRAFSGALSNTDTCFYFCTDGASFEVGTGTYSGGTLARTDIHKSSNADAAVDWGTGPKLIGSDLPGFEELGADDIGFWTAKFPASSTNRGSIELATQAEMETATDVDRAVTPGLLKNHPGVVKAWGFNNTGTTLGASYNVTSITDVGVGVHDWNWDTDFSSVNYMPWVHQVASPAGTAATTLSSHVGASPAAGSFRHSIVRHSDFAATDPTNFLAAALGDQ